MSRIEPTRGQLQAAFGHERRAHWPLELDEALKDPLYSRIIRLHASLLAMGRDPFATQRVNLRPVIEAPEPPHPADAPPAPIQRPPRAAAHRPLPTPSPQLPLIDRKRAAAGDNDD